jgi:hypothetical protein
LKGIMKRILESRLVRTPRRYSRFVHGPPAPARAVSVRTSPNPSGSPWVGILLLSSAGPTFTTLQPRGTSTLRGIAFGTASRPDVCWGSPSPWYQLDFKLIMVDQPDTPFGYVSYYFNPWVDRLVVGHPL